MHFSRLAIAGCMLVDIERHEDQRGFFGRVYCQTEFAQEGLPATMVQASISYNRYAGTLRGMHFQLPPSQEGKLVRCIRGAVHDVLLDLRTGSPDYLKHLAVTLDDANRTAVFIPPGVAHGFQTLADHTEVLYMMTDHFAPQLGAGVRWDDRAFGISWPRPVSVISDRDAAYPDFNGDGWTPAPAHDPAAGQSQT